MRWELILAGFLLISLGSTVFAVTDANLVAWYNFEEASGNTLDQRSANNGTTYNITYQQAGLYDYAYTFTGGISSAVSFGSPADFEPVITGYSWGGWVYTTVNSGEQTVFGKALAASGNDVKWRLVLYNSDAYCGVGNTAGTLYQINLTGAKDRWQFIVCTFDGSYVRTYINGQEKKIAWSGNLPTTDKQARMGVRVDSANPYSGKMDNMFFFRRALSGLDINQLYNSGSGLQYCKDSNTFATSCGATDPCAPTINADWVINTALTCENKRIDLGSGKLVFNTGGSLKLYDSNIRMSQLKMNGFGNFIYIFARSFLRIK